jgi:hypothetical protein
MLCQVIRDPVNKKGSSPIRKYTGLYFPALKSDIIPSKVINGSLFLID